MTLARHFRSLRHLAVCRVFAPAAAGLLCACSLGPPPGTQAPGSQPPSTSASPQGETATRDQYIVRALAPSQPKALDGRRLVGQGSGFFVTPTDVVTNFHVAGNCTLVTVGNASDAPEQIAEPLAKDELDDLELLKVDGSAEPARFVFDTAAESGQDLAVIGYPEHGLTVRQAEFDSVDALPSQLGSAAPRYQFNGSIRRGNSGSPVLDDTGAVVGVVVQKIDTVAVYQHTGEVIDNIGIAIANRTVLAFLRENNVSIEAATPSVPLTPDRLLQKAHGFVRQIGCWR